MTNLLSETKIDIKRSGHQITDIVFIGSQSSGHSCSWKQFVKLANQEYDDSFGAVQVADDLIIVFSDGQSMWRGEYDGSEWWQYSTPFKQPDKKIAIKSLFAISVGWDSLDRINQESNKPKGA